MHCIPKELYLGLLFIKLSSKIYESFANIILAFLCLSFSCGVLLLGLWSQSPTGFNVRHMVWAETTTPDCSRSA